MENSLRCVSNNGMSGVIRFEEGSVFVVFVCSTSCVCVLVSFSFHVFFLTLDEKSSKSLSLAANDVAALLFGTTDVIKGFPTPKADTRDRVLKVARAIAITPY